MYKHVRKHVRRHKVKIFAAFGMLILGASVAALLNWQTSQAQTTGPKLLQVADIDSVNGMQTSNPLANYPAGNSQYPGQEISFDNEGISIFIAPTTQTTAITTDGTVPECGHLGIQEWKGANYAYKLTDGNTWQKRKSTCAGYVVIGSSGQIRAQTLTIKGTSVDGKSFTLQLNVPDPSSWDNEVGGGSRRLYVSDTGGVYACKSLTYHGAWPNECEFSPQTALQMSPVSTGMGAICGNGLCQYGESYASCSADCPAPPPTCTLTLNDNKTSYTADSTTFVNYTYTCSAPTSVAVQVVKPDGIATTYNTSTNITTSTMGFGTANLAAGNYTLRICVNDTTCSPSSLVSVPFTVVAPVVTVTPNSLIGHWKFDGNGNNEVTGSPAATIVGNASFKTTGGKLGGYGYVPTGSDSFKIPYNAMFDLADSFTIEFWFRQRANQSFNQNLVYKGSAPNNYNFNISRWLWNEYNYGPVIAGHTAANTGYWTQPSNPNQLAHNEWHNVVFTKSPNYHAYYLDGALIGSKDITSTSNSEYGGPAKTPHNDIIIGDTAVDTDFDNLKIYNYALSAAEVSAIGGFPVSATPCTGMNISTNKTSYSSGESAVVNYSCASPANGSLNSLIIQVIPPNGTSNNAVNVATINPVSGATTISSSGTQTIPSSYFTSTGSYLVRTCMNSNCTAGLNSVSINYASSGTTPGAGAPEPSNDDAAAWAQVDIATGQILSTAVCKKSVCGINGEYHGYVPPATWTTGSTWWPTSKRYIWQMPGQAGYSTGTFNFSTYIFTVTGGTIYNGVFTTTATPTTPTTTGTTTTVTGSAQSCGANEKCPSGSWCSSGSMCYYPDKQIRCEPWPAASTTALAMPAMNMPSCTDGTSPCGPDDANCVAPGQTVAYSSTSSKWCMQSQQYYSTDGKNMKCVKMGDPAPDGYSTCRPDDTNCIPSGKYGKSDGWCSMGMTCYQKTTDSDPKNDKYCAPMNYSSTDPSAVSCPSGYSYCSPTDTYCKQKNDSWTDSNSSYWCSNSQKCTVASGGGTCVGWNEVCPAGTKYCNASDTNCIEPGEYKTISSTSGAMSSYWCGGGGGMTFYSSTKAYCEPKKAGTTMMMWSAADIKAILAKLGTGWGLCGPGNTNCIEPGKTGPSSGWCAWMQPGTWTSPPSSTATTRTCPSLDDSGTTTPLLITPPPVVEPPMCMHVLTKASNASTGECKVFPDSCLPAGWVRNVDCKPGEIIPPGEIPPPAPPVPGEIRECGPNEMPGGVSAMSTSVCVMPMYRWNIDKREFEKCDRNKLPPYVNVMLKKATYTNCESFNFEIEREWRAERFAAHDPRIDGEWYMPPWDASSEMLQYNTKSDQFEACNAKRMMNYTATPNEYMAPCTPVPEKDRGWMLKKFRAENKMFQLWQRGNQGGGGTPTYPPGMPMPPGQPVLTPVPMPQPVPMPLSPGDLTPAQCKTYLKGIRQSISGDKMFWKQINTQISQVPDEYADKATLQQLLKDASAIIVEADKYVKAGKCDSASMSALQERLNTLRTDIFSDISSYLPDVQSFIDAGHCKVGLNDKVKQLQGLLKNGLDDEAKAGIEDLISSIGEKLREIDERSGDFDYDAGFECRQFAGEVESQVAPMLRSGDKELNRIIEDVVGQKLEPVLEKLSAQLEDRGKKIDELLVKVAELHQAVEKISGAATQISEKIAVSYTALSRIEDKFAEQKAQIQETKDRLLSLVEQATGLMKTVSCVRGANKEAMVQEFGNIATVNWFGERADALEKRLNLFISSCKAREVNSAYVTTFMTSVDDAERRNQEASFAAGLTRFPDVPTHEWYYGAMQTAGENGFMTQGRPGENVLKQDALLMILRASGAPESEITGNCTLRVHGIGAVSPYAVCAANYAYDKGLILTGSLTSPISRVEMVEWLVKLSGVPVANLSVLDKYTDLAGLSASEKAAIAAVVAREIMVGNVSGDSARFDVKSPITRAALAVILEKLTMQKNMVEFNPNPLRVLEVE
ncbi:hypothetical protein HZC21_05740 [Candidatus Peregrinibacteria bacterium]|nr:hypothetical protein [Candidatus Peregrinibacteria bacterium]